MLVRCVDNLTELGPYLERWEALAGGCAFRSPAWLTTWWRHYGEGDPRRELRVYLAFDSAAPTAALAGVLPAYVDRSWSQGRVLRLLGDGEACSDHLGLLAAPESTGAAAAAIAAHLAEQDDWDLVDFAAVDGDDAATHALFDGLALADCTTSRLLADRCWAIELPPTWDEFLAMQSKSHRKQLRQHEARTLRSPRVRWVQAATSDEFAAAWSTLVELHQRRRQSLGEPGCFASRRWAAFNWDAAQRLLAEGRLRLSCLHLDDRPIAVEYHFAGGDTTYAYQGGVDPDQLAEEPGQLSMILALQAAIAEGRSRFDLLRGDEPYKAHWRATPRQAVRLLAVPPRMWPKLRRGAWTTAREAALAARRLAGVGVKTPLVRQEGYGAGREARTS